MKTALHNKLILHTVDMYLEKALENECYQKDMLREIRTRTIGYKTFHRFSPEESKEVVALGEHEFMKKLKDRHVDFAVYALSLLTEWVERTPKKERPTLNISDKRILGAKTALIMDMLRLKHTSPDIYEKVKDIIDESKAVAKLYICYTKEEGKL